jgi:phage baseplate assembly protein W
MATTSRKRDHLGIGWTFPIRPINGALTYIKYEDDVEQSINIILETARKERVMVPTFGAGLRDWVFASNSPQTQRAIESEVRRALTDHEERINVESVRASASADTPNVLLIEIDYVVRATNSTFNMVYPFYLTEGA